MKPGTKVKILCDTWMAPSGVTGTVHTKNLTEGLISVQYDEEWGGTIFDFDPSFLSPSEQTDRVVSPDGSKNGK